jgi:hypothetical protein
MSEPSAPDHRWLLLLVQLPTKPAAPRIRLWRRLQQIGSVALRGSVYALPDTPAAREDFEWLRTEVMAAGGQATILGARTLTPDEDRAIVVAFQDARSEDFKQLTASIRPIAAGRGSLSPDARRDAEKTLRAAQQELSRIEAIDFGGAPERDAAIAALSALAARLERNNRSEAMPAAERLSASSYRRRTWVTRPRPGVDRMSSAWLIRRFIDPKAKFAFRAARPGPRSKEIPFDMFDVEFGHAGDRCTFEVLARRFAVDEDPAVRRIGEIVHDVDLKDTRYGHAEAAVVRELVEGLRRAHSDDNDLLAHGMAVFGGLYESFSAASVRPVAHKGPRKRRGR